MASPGTPGGGGAPTLLRPAHTGLPRPEKEARPKAGRFSCSQEDRPLGSGWDSEERGPPQFCGCQQERSWRLKRTAMQRRTCGPWGRCRAHCSWGPGRPPSPVSPPGSGHGPGCPVPPGEVLQPWAAVGSPDSFSGRYRFLTRSGRGPSPQPAARPGTRCLTAVGSQKGAHLRHRQALSPQAPDEPAPKPCGAFLGPGPLGRRSRGPAESSGIRRERLGFVLTDDSPHTLPARAPLGEVSCPLPRVPTASLSQRRER